MFRKKEDFEDNEFSPLWKVVIMVACFVVEILLINAILNFDEREEAKYQQPYEKELVK